MYGGRDPVIPTTPFTYWIRLGWPRNATLTAWYFLMEATFGVGVRNWVGYHRLTIPLPKIYILCIFVYVVILLFFIYNLLVYLLTTMSPDGK